MSVRRGGDHELHAGPGWYYLDGNHKAPAWTGVPYFYRFLTRSAPSRGPVGSRLRRSCCFRGTLSSFGLMHLSLDILLWWWRWQSAHSGQDPGGGPQPGRGPPPSKYLLLPGDPGDPYSGRALLNSYLSLCRGHSDEEMLSLAVHF